jgi:hypothetical protein
MQYAKGEKMEKPEKSEMKKFATGGSTPKNKAPASRMVSPDTEYPRSTSGKDAKNWGEGMGQNYEGMTKAYGKYKQSDDPSVKEVTKRLNASSQDALDRTSRALSASDRARRAGDDEARAKINKGAAPKPGEYNFKKGGKVKTKCYAAGGSVSKGDGCATKGRTKGRII